MDSCKLPGSRLHDRCNPVHLDTEPAHVVHVDNFCAFSNTKEEAEELRDRVWKEALRCGLVVHETFCSSGFEFFLPSLRWHPGQGQADPKTFLETPPGAPGFASIGPVLQQEHA